MTEELCKKLIKPRIHLLNIAYQSAYQVSFHFRNLRQEHGAGSEISYITHLNRSINPQEIEALQAVLEVIRAVANYDELSRIAICENPNWAPLQILLGKLNNLLFNVLF